MTIKTFSTRHQLWIESDECGERICRGLSGDSHIFEFGGGRMALCFVPDPHGKRPLTGEWAGWKKRLLAAGFVVTQDGDGEGIATFDSKNPVQVALAIDAAGCPRRIEKPEHLGAYQLQAI